MACQFLVQALLVITFTLMQILVEMCRNEHVWQKVSDYCGTRPAEEAHLIAAVRCWRTLLFTLLFTLLKALLHWLVGQAAVSYGYTDDMTRFYIRLSSTRLLLLAVALVLMTLFTTWMAFWRQNGATWYTLWQQEGSQPPTYGHFPTLMK